MHLSTKLVVSLIKAPRGFLSLGKHNGSLYKEQIKIVNSYDLNEFASNTLVSCDLFGHP